VLVNEVEEGEQLADDAKDALELYDPELPEAYG